MRKKICIALAIIWMGVIFYMSNQPASISSYSFWKYNKYYKQIANNR